LGDSASLIDIFVLLIGVGAVVLAAAADTAFGEANRVRLRALAEDEAFLGAMVRRLLEEPPRTWMALHLLEILGLVVATAGAAGLASGSGPLWPTSGSGGVFEALPLIVFALFVLVFVDWAPRIVANMMPERAAVFVALPLHLTAWFVYPIFSVVGRLVGFLPHAEDRALRDDELRSLLHMDEDGVGELAEDDIEMMAGIMEMGDTKTREVMVPRPDIVGIPIDASLDEAVSTIIEAGHSRIPVYRETLDNIAGLLYAKDLLEAFRRRDFEASLVDYLRDPHVVPESTPVKTLLKALRMAKVHMAIVVDEYGGTAGLVTIEDLLEEIVGEIQDEYDEEVPRVEQLDQDEGVFSGGLDIDDVNRMMDIRLPTDEVDTLAGLVLACLGRMPEPGDRAIFEDAEIEVLALEGRRIHRVRITRRNGDEDETSPEFKSEAGLGNATSSGAEALEAGARN
jgi:putative hemolysin